MIGLRHVGRDIENEEEDWVRTGRRIQRDSRCDCCSSLAVVAVRADMVVLWCCSGQVLDNDDEVGMFWSSFRLGLGINGNANLKLS